MSTARRAFANHPGAGTGYRRRRQPRAERMASEASERAVTMDMEAAAVSGTGTASASSSPAPSSGSRGGRSVCRLPARVAGAVVRGLLTFVFAAGRWDAIRFV